MAKLILDSDNFTKSSGQQACADCPLRDQIHCMEFYAFLFGKCTEISVEPKSNPLLSGFELIQ